MYLNIDGFNKINDRIQSQRQLELENQRRAVQDARAAEAFGRQQKQWGLDDALQTEVGAQAGELTGLASAKGYDWRQGIGVPAPTESNPAPGLAAPTNRAAIDQYTAPPADQVPLGLASAVKPGAQERPLGSTPMDDELETIKKQARIAQASRDPAMLAKAQAAFFDHKKRRTAMEMSDYFDSASPDELSRLASSITADKTNKVKAVYDKDSGFTRLETEEGVQNLRPSELKKYLISKALGNIDGMASAQQSNVARTDKDNLTTEKVATVNNRGEYQAGSLDARLAGIEARSAGGLSRDPSIAKAKNEIDAARNKRIDIQARIANLPKQVDARLKTRDAAREELKDLELQQERYDKIIAKAEADVPSSAGLSSIENGTAPALPGASKITPAQQAVNDADRPAILNRELAAAKQRLQQGDPRAQADIDSLNAEIAGGRKKAAPAQTAPGLAKPIAPKPNYSNLWK